MSLAILKKKSKRYKLGCGVYGHGHNGFSLNGGHRNQGWVGQGVRGRHRSRTPYRGLTPVGNGGCCGTYPQHILSQPNCCTNDPGIIKRSTMNTPGYLAATVVHPTSVFNSDCSGTCPKIIVSVDSSGYLDYAHYTHSKGRRAATCDDFAVSSEGYEDSGKVGCISGSPASTLGTCRSSSYIGGKKRPNTPYVKTTHKGATSASEWTGFGLLSSKCLPPPPCKQHWPINYNKVAHCISNYYSPEEAIAAGVLPADWMNCLPGTTAGSSHVTNNAFMSY